MEDRIQHLVVWENVSHNVFNRLERIEDNGITIIRFSTSDGLEMDLTIEETEYLTEQLMYFVPQLKNLEGGFPKNHRMNWRSKDDELLIQLYENGVSNETLSETLERTEQSIVSRIKFLSDKGKITLRDM